MRFFQWRGNASSVREHRLMSPARQSLPFCGHACWAGYQESHIKQLRNQPIRHRDEVGHFGMRISFATAWNSVLKKLFLDQSRRSNICRRNYASYNILTASGNVCMFHPCTYSACIRTFARSISRSIMWVEYPAVREPRRKIGDDGFGIG